MVVKNNGLFPDEQEKKIISKTPTQQAIPQIIAVTVKNILLVAFGLTLGYPTILIPGLTDPAENFSIGQEGLSWIGSINMICVPLGCLASGYISQLLGRRRAMQIVNIPFVAAWLMFNFATEEWQILMALALTGLTGGFLEAPVLTYVAEISQAHLRGMLSSTSSMSVIFGMLIMFCLGTIFHWRTVTLVCCFFHVLSFIFLFFIPESPHWLITKNRLDEARKSIAWLRGWTEVEEIESEFKDLYLEVRKVSVDEPDVEKTKMKSNKQDFWHTIRLFGHKEFLWPFALLSFIFFLSHFSGITTLQIYAIPIFSTLKVSINKYYATVFLGLVQLLGTILCVLVVHFSGKRILNFIALVLMSSSFMVVAIYAHRNNINELVLSPKLLNETAMNSTIAPFVENSTGWIPLTFIICGAFAGYAGIRVLPWILIGEVFPNDIRAASSGMACTASYFFNFIVNKLFFTMIDGIGLSGTFFLYACVGFLGVIILYFVLPETEGKTLAQICEHFAGGDSMGNHVNRRIMTDISMKNGQENKGYLDDSHIKMESRL